jgi:lysophospholipase L1-like esterase
MTRTVLFFGDSNTRGYGVGRAGRYAALVEAELRADGIGDWQFALEYAVSDFRVIPGRLEAAVATHVPRVIVWQCPTGPASFFVNYPRWIAAPRALYHRLLERLQERYIRADVRADPTRQRSRYDALYEGRYLDTLHRWKPWHVPGALALRRHVARRHGVIAKTTGERYVRRICRLRDATLAQMPASILFLGLLPLSDEYYTGYTQRAKEWGAALAAVLHEPAASRFYLDVHEPLTRNGTERLLLRDGTHLSPEGHRRLAGIVAPRLRELMLACGDSARAAD